MAKLDHERMDVVDMLIGVLMEHEKKLDELVERMEKACDRCPVLKDDVREDWL